MRRWLASLFRADGDTQDRSPTADFWYEPLMGGRFGAGQRRISADQAMRLSTVYACVRIQAESFAILPFRLYRPKAAGRGRTRVTDHWLVRLMKRPNAYQNAFEWREMLQGHVGLRGNAYCRIVPDGVGGIAQLMPMHPDRTTVDPLDNGSWRYRYLAPNGETQYFTRQEVWHLRGLSSDGVVGIDPIQAQRELLTGALGAQDYANRFWANDAKPSGGWLEYPGKIPTQAQREELKKQLANVASGANRFRILVLDQGMKYHEVGVTNKNAQFIEARGYTRTEIAAMFRVPPHMIGDLSRATFSNIEQQSIDFWMGCMLPWMERWEAALEALLPEDDGLEVEFDFRNLLRGDTEARAQYIQSMVLTGVLNRNEGREIEGYDPADGLDTFLVPTNEQMVSKGRLLAPPTTPVQTPAQEDDEEDEQGDNAAASGRHLVEKRIAAARLHAVVDGNAARLARRFARAEAGTIDAELLASALAIDLETSTAWLAAHARDVFNEEDLRSALVALGSRS